jgi:hypothetical protein
MTTVATDDQNAEEQAKKDILANTNSPMLNEEQVCDRQWETVNHPVCWDFDRFTHTMRNA